MRLKSSSVIGSLLLGTATMLVPSLGWSQVNIVKPEFLLMVDTSGSMATTDAGPNSCGYANQSRINAAACVVRNIADGVGDGIFGFGTFAQTCNAGNACHYAGSCGATGCAGVVVPGYPFPFRGCQDGGKLAVAISELNQYDMRTWGDGSFTSCTIPSGLVPAALGGNELAQVATCGTGAASGLTPLAGLLHTAWRYLSNQRNAPAVPVSPYVNFNGTGLRDPYARCRPVNVIMLTDGGETCVAAVDAPNNARNIGCMRLDFNGDGDTTDPGEFNSDLNADGDCYDAGEQAAFRTRTLPIFFGPRPGVAGDANIEAIALGGGSTAHPVTTTGGSRNLLGYYASNEAEVSDAISDIVAGSQLIELCNGIDDNCNGLVDEGFNLGAACTVNNRACTANGTIICNVADRTQAICSATPPAIVAENTAVTCRDNVDNDCDGAIDCADPDCNAQPFCIPGCVPTAEVCDGRDNNCNGQVDEGMISRTCGVDIGVCTSGVEVCQPQAAPGNGMAIFSACTGRLPSAEVCDGLDNNCNGVADEGLTRACGSMVGACRPGVQLCVGGMFGGACVGEVTGTAEICDGIDNDCDGMTDENIPSAGSCGAAGVGICTAGTIQCQGGMLVCVGGMMGRPETCNGLDDDCNGVVDDGIAAGATCQPMGMMIPVNAMGMPIGTCRLGNQVCEMGATVCRGAVGPSAEVCNGMDDNCNGMIDEGLDGMACGLNVGACMPGVLRCVMGRQSCVGGTGPSEEVCDGVDNDCDGEVDEGNPGGGGRCGSNVGVCRPGVNVCRMGMVVCDGAVGPGMETCNGLDDDCDGTVDNGVMEGEVCGSNVGRCMQGRTRCLNGRSVCEGAVGPRAEECNCQDDDCNGMVDEAGMGGAGLCGGGSVCAGAPSCGCLRPCADGEFPCPAGRTCQTIGGQRLCVGDPCTGVNCAPGQVCMNGACRGLCDGVTCDPGLACNPQTGRCVANDCRILNNCAASELCRMGRCVPNPCAGVNCPMGQACYEGTCAPSCAGVTCPMAQHCERGACVPDAAMDRCAMVTCRDNRVCNPTNGMCEVSRCGAGTTCPPGSSCDPITGMCIDDPCAVVRCPADQTCRNGQCSAAPNNPNNVAADRVISSGGGCSVSPHGGASQGTLNSRAILLGMIAMTSVVVRRKRRAKNHKNNAQTKGEVAR